LLTVAIACALAAVFAAPAMATTRAAAGKTNGGCGKDGGGCLAPPPNTSGAPFVKATLNCGYLAMDGVVVPVSVQGTEYLDAGKWTCGLGIPPAGAPQTIKDIIYAANQIAYNPYVLGGGHGCYGGLDCPADSKDKVRDKAGAGFDCSGSVSWALHADGIKVAEMLASPLDSSQFEKWGKNGFGEWISVYTTSGHAFMKIDGLWFDTVIAQSPAKGEHKGDRWGLTDPWEFSKYGRPKGGWTIRHPKGW
jgi:hypothetical protein